MINLSSTSQSCAPFSATDSAISYWLETIDHDVQIKQINQIVFGPGRFVRASYLLREDGEHDRQLSFVACLGDYVIGSVRMTPIYIGIQTACLLGPLVVRPDHKNVGVGSKLVRMALQAAENCNIPLVILIGDKDYYGRFNFKNVQHGQIQMPAPVNPQRLLVLELQEDALKTAHGKVRYRSCS
ncbi:N-acetyltransferase [Bartonella sp. WD12.1]|uniref:GNAT family N-acetyltransferase n=1 Tax=Bartonella sp. WD12.1 TaxID=1933903 RepID=UPI00099A3B0C|nr:N-acetyltransferase [Bartonella sp. WD12.1]OPB29954.1 putative N-acetyltransferase YhbS [Bartonella sp. WD12.1]